MKKELLDESSEIDIYNGSLRATLKKVLNWKTPGHDGIHRFWV